MRDALHETRFPSHSTSAPSNLMEQYGAAAKLEASEQITKTIEWVRTEPERAARYKAAEEQRIADKRATVARRRGSAAARRTNFGPE